MLYKQYSPSFRQIARKPWPNNQEHAIPVIAHRGASGFAPENTIAAFDLAVEMKADYIELDVQMSKDGEVVVIHDTTVNRTADVIFNEPIAVADLKLQQLKKLDVGSVYDPMYRSEQIPTLDEVLTRYKGKINFLIELKSPELYNGVEEAVTELLEKHQLDNTGNGEVILQSFNFGAAAYLSQLLPMTPLGVLTSKAADLTNRKLEKIAAYSDFVNTHYTNVMNDETLVRRIHEKGMKITPWTIRAPGEVEPLIRAGVDGIITDYPNYVR